MAPPKVPIAERFATKYRVDEYTGCWVWTAGLLPNGYGQFRTSTGKGGNAHRAAYELFVGPIPKGAQIHHGCHNRACVNPDHLEAVTPAENVAERLDFAREYARAFDQKKRAAAVKTAAL